MTTLPTGEKLPEYDEPADDGIDMAKVQAWLVANRGVHVDWIGDPRTIHVIRSVVEALQAVGDATLVRNATYRAMRRDGADVEKLNAWLANHDLAELLVQHDGDAVAAAITGLDLRRTYEHAEVKRAEQAAHPVRYMTGFEDDAQFPVDDDRS